MNSALWVCMGCEQAYEQNVFVCPRCRPDPLPFMVQDRLKQIDACMWELQVIRRERAKVLAAMVGEADQLSELHRLLYDEGHAATNRAVNTSVKGEACQ